RCVLSSTKRWSNRPVTLVGNSYLPTSLSGVPFEALLAAEFSRSRAKFDADTNASIPEISRKMVILLIRSSPRFHSELPAFRGNQDRPAAILIASLLRQP